MFVVHKSRLRDVAGFRALLTRPDSISAAVCLSSTVSHLAAASARTGTSFATLSCLCKTFSQELRGRQTTTHSRVGFWFFQEPPHSVSPTGTCSPPSSVPQDILASSPAMSSNGYCIPSPSGSQSTASLKLSNRTNAPVPLQPETPNKALTRRGKPRGWAQLLGSHSVSHKVP